MATVHNERIINIEIIQEIHYFWRLTATARGVFTVWMCSARVCMCVLPECANIDTSAIKEFHLIQLRDEIRFARFPRKLFSSHGSFTGVDDYKRNLKS